MTEKTETKIIEPKFRPFYEGMKRYQLSPDLASGGNDRYITLKNPHEGCMVGKSGALTLFDSSKPDEENNPISQIEILTILNCNSEKKRELSQVCFLKNTNEYLILEYSWKSKKKKGSFQIKSGAYFKIPASGKSREVILRHRQYVMFGWSYKGTSYKNSILPNPNRSELVYQTQANRFSLGVLNTRNKKILKTYESKNFNKGWVSDFKVLPSGKIIAISYRGHLDVYSETLDFIQSWRLPEFRSHLGANSLCVSSNQAETRIQAMVNTSDYHKRESIIHCQITKKENHKSKKKPYKLDLIECHVNKVTGFQNYNYLGSMESFKLNENDEYPLYVGVEWGGKNGLVSYQRSKEDEKLKNVCSFFNFMKLNGLGAPGVSSSFGRYKNTLWVMTSSGRMRKMQIKISQKNK